MRFRTAAASAAAVMIGAASLAVSGSPATAAARVTIGSRPAWAKSAARVGSFDAKRRLTVRVYLQLRNPAEAAARVRAVSDPTSAQYHHYLSTAAFHARYSPSTADAAAVSAWLRSSGLRVLPLPANRVFVAAVGTGAQIERAFGARLGEYRSRGLQLRAADGTISAPASLAGKVAGVVGLSQSQALLRPTHIADTDAPTAPPPGAFVNAPPCSNAYGDTVGTGLPAYGSYPNPLPWAECKKTPPQLRKAYGIEAAVASGLDGRGTTVGIVDAFASPTILRDAITYSQRNDPAHVLRASQYAQIVPDGIFEVGADNFCDPQGWYGEQTLDVEAVHAIAPGANILYSGGKSCEDPAIDAALNKLVDGNVVDMVSNSYGNVGEDIPKEEFEAFHAIATQAALQGIGIYFSSGDDGDEAASLGEASPDWTASSPLVTAVGGTSMTIDAAGNIAVEQGWETAKSTLLPESGNWEPRSPGAFLYGSGGGTSRAFAEPWYQRGVVPDALATKWGGRGRVVPDVAMLGDPTTGMLVGETQTFVNGVHYGEYRIGGTSLSCPLFTAMMALADQRAGWRHGFANPALYHLSSSSFRDIVPGPLTAELRRNYNNGQNDHDGFSDPTVRTFDYSGLTIHTAVGYDDVTGRGVPVGVTFLDALAG